MRRALYSALLLSALAPAAAFAQSTTRIETRPFYGATVTLEEGVRVFRPLPSHDRVIINPGGTTPLSLGITDQRSVSYNYNDNQGSADGSPTYVTGGGFYGSGHNRNGRDGGRGGNRGSPPSGAFVGSGGIGGRR